MAIKRPAAVSNYWYRYSLNKKSAIIKLLGGNHRNKKTVNKEN